MSNSSFKVKFTFELTVRDAFIVVGEILSGEINNNQFLVSGALSIIINSVEFVDSREFMGLIGLVFKNITPSELNYLTQLKENDIVTIIDAPIA